MTETTVHLAVILAGLHFTAIDPLTAESCEQAVKAIGNTATAICVQEEPACGRKKKLKCKGRAE